MTEFFSMTDEDAARLSLHGPFEEDIAAAKQLLAPVDPDTNGDKPDPPIHVETWAEFERSATDHIPTLVDGLWPENALGFIAAPPKKGKTWLGLSLAISVATGRPFLSTFDVPKPTTVVYLALEGHRAAIRGRIGCLARGQGLNPDPSSSDLERLHIVYKPRGMNLNSARWVQFVRDTVDTLTARLLVVDVLRRAAALKENSNDEWNAFLALLDPIPATGCSVALLHHFGKVTEITKERTPGERMAGAGSMQGSYDVGVFITGSSDSARTLRIECETRDMADPDPLGLHLAGTPTGVNGGFIYTDTAYWTIQEAPETDDLAAAAAVVAPWLEQQPDRSATTAEIAFAFNCHPKTVTRRRVEYQEAGIEYVPSKGSRPSVFRLPEHLDTHLDKTPGHLAGVPQISLVPRGNDDPHPDMDNPDISACLPGQMPDLQRLVHVDTGTSPTEMQPPADATAADTPNRDDLEPDEDELNLTAGTLDP